ncbi:glutamate-rich WD repeat-containing protein 1-like [Amphibalanus amphitrite]|uniref:glutamate-rich WD repeat-containing protein 1-like n=1 Tax=Amphibalanus amphitrite TaxID=1232801 RepID=UPI001C90D97C|nr:glutamate-rich WD repeat-containing protein 1-like [Amphibalanus amphitrite]XP_043200524.1 glutamate-rich WD repeat-containing protein 1-like [Amphibalanus amphitrite]XP_043200525.1 glutamate-rich WD repeat-containing protein 1-like [Amphibalanus amphitrite]XP_043200526.1 glutamate-rich WD repeat-containing protein 1-like [Amphibalanus amphitrite]XP_043200527.1 glutamate-rich WD repeat-containing protein 1-like [Amphibalanus amphitrite]
MDEDGEPGPPAPEQEDAPMEDAEEDGEEEDTPAGPSEVFLPGRQLEEDEELVVDESAYVMFHQAHTGDPCLSFDVVRDRLGDNRTEYPLTMYMVAGTQADKAHKNSVIVMKMSNIQRNKKSKEKDSDDEESDESDDEEEDLPDLETATMKHHGCVNRIRATTIQDTPLAATWSETGSVHVWSLARPLAAVDDPMVASAYARDSEDKKAKPLFTFKGHEQEGFAMDWSPLKAGVLATGDCGRHIHVWQPAEGGTWHVDQRPYSAHKGSVEDIQWSPSEPTVFASCSVDKSIRIWDSRAAPAKACMLQVTDAHDSDVNVISWNRTDPFIVSGGDDGKLCVWDLRSLQSGKPVALFKHHSAPVTTVEWHPSDSTVFASGGADDQVVQWDLAVERDDEAAAEGAAEGAEEDQKLNELPPQLLFIHQGQEDVKELHWHPQATGCLLSTAHSGFNVFRTISV